MLNKSYINIQGWMIHELKLSGNDLLIYAIIYGFSQDGQNTFYGSLSYIETMLNVSKNGVRNSLKNLIEKGYIEKVKLSHYRAITVSKSDTEGYQKLIQTVSKSDTETVSKIDTNNNNTINKNKNASGDLSPDVPKVIEAFSKVDPKNKEYYGRADMRKASHFLISEYGLEKVIGVIENLPLFIETIPYFPSISNPKELKENWTKAKNAFIREELKKKQEKRKEETKKTSVSI